MRYPNVQFFFSVDGSLSLPPLYLDFVIFRVPPVLLPFDMLLIYIYLFAAVINCRVDRGFSAAAFNVAYSEKICSAESSDRVVPLDVTTPMTVLLLG